MQSDEDELVTLSKWPFYLGDLLLVATALAIALLQGWELSTGQIAACVAAVGLGAVLFVLPYIVEFQIRVREEQEDRGAGLRAVERQLQDQQSVVEALHARIVDLERQLSNSAEATDVVAVAIEQKVVEIEAFKDSQQAEVARLDKALAELAEKAGKVETDPEITKSIEKLGKKVEELSKGFGLEQLAERVAQLEAAPTVEAPAAEEAPATRPSHSARKRRKPEPRLLNRAIPEKEESASAVSRIIKSEDGGQKTDARGQESEDAIEIIEKASKSGLAKDAPDTTQTREPEPEPEPFEDAPDMFAEAVPATPKAKKKKSDTSLTATIFIGIGNKPYLRGSGGGLSSEKGIAMEFVEIGKWSWAPEGELEGPIELQILRNDEDLDKNGTITLEPGQKLVVSPEF